MKFVILPSYLLAITTYSDIRCPYIMYLFSRFLRFKSTFVLKWLILTKFVLITNHDIHGDQLVNIYLAFVLLVLKVAQWAMVQILIGFIDNTQHGCLLVHTPAQRTLHSFGLVYFVEAGYAKLVLAWKCAVENLGAQADSTFVIFLFSVNFLFIFFYNSLKFLVFNFFCIENVFDVWTLYG